MKTIVLLISSLFFYTQNLLQAQFAQYNMLDNSFGDNGKISLDLSKTNFKGVTRTQSVLLQKDGKIITAGQAQTGIIVHIFLARFLPDGNVDTSFGIRGFIYWGNSDYDLLYQAQLQSDGKIVAVILSNGKKYLIRFTTSGFDSSFGNNGFVQLAHTSPSLAVDEADNIITGEAYVQKGLLVCAAQRFKKDGAPDNNFGTNNFTSIAIYKYDGYLDIPCKIKLDNNGNIVLGSTCYTTLNNVSNAYFTIVRFTTHGVIDSSFNKSGLLVFRKLNYASMLTSIVHSKR